MDTAQSYYKKNNYDCNKSLMTKWQALVPVLRCLLLLAAL